MRATWLAVAAGCSPADDAAPVEPVDPCEAPGAICTWVGVPREVAASTEPTPRLEARLYLPRDVAFAADGRAFIAEVANHRILQVDPDGLVSPVAGTSFLGDGPPDAAEGCWGGCDARRYAFNSPAAVHADPLDPDVLWVAATRNSRVVRIDLADERATWWVGTGGRSYGAGHRTEAILDLPVDVAVDPATGDLYLTDQANHLIRRVDADGTVVDVAGQPRVPGYAGDGGAAEEALLHGRVDRSSGPECGLAIADGVLYTSDSVNGVVRAVDLRSGLIRTVAGRHVPWGTTEYTDPVTGEVYTADAGSVAGYDGDGEATEVLLARPSDVAVGPRGELYIADTGNHCVRAVDPETGWLSTVAGRCTAAGFGGDGGPARAALLHDPTGLAVDAAGDLYVVDTRNHVIRRIKAPRIGGPHGDEPASDETQVADRR